MTFWNYIGEFFLFRWLFGFHKHNESKRNLSDTPSNFVTMIRTQALVAAMKIVTLVMTTMIMAIHNRMTIFMTSRTATT